ncbi:MAG: hypothetical protein OJF49_003392 [Ktedonobacterales bacterium]|jgi:hypothetical protein|nr:MAG: hypothetical protein OJF49_003392 [Ktedonobacterales bacterium]
MWGQDERRLRQQPQQQQQPHGGVAGRPDEGGRAGEHAGEHGAEQERPGARVAQGDAGDMDAGTAAAGMSAARGVGMGARVVDAAELRLEARRLIREFLRAVPRAEADATLVFLRVDGTPRMVTRGELSARIDWMRPRMRQIVRLSVEERWPRQEVCNYLHGISLKTFERDQVEGLDLLVDM